MFDTSSLRRFLGARRTRFLASLGVAVSAAMGQDCEGVSEDEHLRIHWRYNYVGNPFYPDGLQGAYVTLVGVNAAERLELLSVDFRTYDMPFTLSPYEELLTREDTVSDDRTVFRYGLDDRADTMIRPWYDDYDSFHLLSAAGFPGVLAPQPAMYKDTELHYEALDQISGEVHTGVLDFVTIQALECRTEVPACLGEVLECDGQPGLDVCEPDLADRDCDGNGLVDACESGDCDANGTPDHCDILFNPGTDCDADGILDVCQWVDCDEDGVADSCQIAAQPELDCNGDDVLDHCDPIDRDGDGVDDRCQAKVHYVDADAPPNGDGKSWQSAFDDLDRVLEVLTSNDRVMFAAGAYTLPLSNRSFLRLPSRVHYLGGFAGFGTARPSERDLGRWRTSFTSAGYGGGLVLGDGSVMDGLAFYNSAELRVIAWNTTIDRCLFDGNQDFSLSLRNSTLRQSAVRANATGYGAVYLSGACTVDGVVIEGNETRRSMVYADGENNQIRNSVLRFNAGDVLLEIARRSSLHVEGTLLAAPDEGVARVYGHLQMDGCTAYHFSNEEYPRLIVGGEGTAQLRNTIVWSEHVYYTANFDRFREITFEHCILNPQYADVSGSDNLFTDPRLVSPEDGDFRLQPNSPAIDAGNTAFLPTDAADGDGDCDRAEPAALDLLGNTRIVGASVDIGAYEFGAESARGCVGDLDGNRQIDTADLMLLLASFGTHAAEDLDCDGQVQLNDLAILLTRFGATCD